MNYGKANCGINCRDCEWYGICPHSYAQFDEESEQIRRDNNETKYKEPRKERGLRIVIDEKLYFDLCDEAVTSNQTLNDTIVDRLMRKYSRIDANE